MKKVTIDGIGEITVPSDATDQDILDLVNSMGEDELRKIIAQTPPETITGQLGRQAGLFGRAAAKSLASGFGFGNALIDPIASLAGLETPSAAQERMMTKMGLPEPSTPMERGVYDVNQALTSTGGVQQLAAKYGPGIASTVGQNVAGMLAADPRAQAAVTAASTAGSSAAREGGLPPWAQMGVGMISGAVTPGGTSLPTTQRLLEGAKSTVKPFTREGREVIAGQVLRNLATDPEAAATRLIGQSQPVVPGVRPTTAAAARDPGLAGAETAIRGLDTQGNLFGARLSSNQQALMDAYRRLSGTDETLSLAKNLRNAYTAPKREAAFAPENMRLSDETFQTAKTLFVDKTVRDIMQSKVGVRKDVSDAMTFAQDRISKAKTAEELYEVRKDLAGALQGKYSAEMPNIKLAKGQLTDVIKSIDSLLESAAPGYENYMSSFQRWSKPIDRMNTLRAIESKVTTGQPNLVTGDTVLAAAALRRQVAQRADDIGLKLSDQAQQKLDDIVFEINRGQAATAPGIKPPGSDTFKNLSVGNLIGKVISQSMADNTTLRTMTRPLDWLYKLPDQQMQTLLVEAMLDPQLAGMMMRKAGVMTVDPVAKALRKKAIELGYGGAIGLQQGVE